MKIEINLPEFCGFYGTQLGDLFDVSDDLESYGDVTEEEYEKIDWKKVFNDIGATYVIEFWEQNSKYLQTVGIKSIEFVEVDSPREYNFTTDKLVVSVEYDMDVFKAAIIKTVSKYPDSFSDYVEARYSSYSGFVSFYSSSPDDWMEDYINRLDEDNNIFEGFLLFLLSTDEDAVWYNTEDIIDKVLEQKHNCLHFIND